MLPKPLQHIHFCSFARTAIWADAATCTKKKKKIGRIIPGTNRFSYEACAKFLSWKHPQLPCLWQYTWAKMNFILNKKILRFMSQAKRERQVGAQREEVKVGAKECKTMDEFESNSQLGGSQWNDSNEGRRNMNKETSAFYLFHYYFLGKAFVFRPLLPSKLILERTNSPILYSSYRLSQENNLYSMASTARVLAPTSAKIFTPWMLSDITRFVHVLWMKLDLVIWRAATKLSWDLGEKRFQQAAHVSKAQSQRSCQTIGSWGISDMDCSCLPNSMLNGFLGNPM